MAHSPEHSRLAISSETIAEIVFLSILIWMLSGPISGLVLSLYSSLSGVVTKSAYSVESTKNLAEQLLVASDQIKTLEKKLADSDLELAKLREKAKDTENLRALLGLRSELNRQTIAADIISRNPDNWFQQATIDRGKNDGIIVGSAVIASQGIVGQIIQVSDHASVVRLLTDPAQKLGVSIERIHQPGVLVGKEQKMPIIDFVPVGASVEIGDKVVSLGNGGIFPAGRPVGTVAAVGRDTNGTTLNIEVKLTEDFYNLRQVLVVPPEVR